MSDFFLYIIAIFLPPLPVIAKRGCGGAVFVNLILDILGWVPGVLRKYIASLCLVAVDRLVNRVSCVQMPGISLPRHLDVETMGHLHKITIGVATGIEIYWGASSKGLR